MADLLKLAERCEAATGPDRELDAAIEVALKVGCRANLPDDLEYLSEISLSDYEARQRKAGHYWFHCRSGKSMRSADRYTLSLDAAMTLVPDVITWGVGAGTLGSYARVVTDEPETVAHWCRIAATPALALTAASLRARAASSKES